MGAQDSGQVCPIFRNPEIQKGNVHKPGKTRSDSSIYNRGLTMGFLKNKNQLSNLVNMFHCPQNKNKKEFTCTISGHAYYLKKDATTVLSLLKASSNAC